jgi:glutamine synthetase
LGRVFIEEAMDVTGINRTNLVGVCTHLIRTKQASSQSDALRRLEAGEFEKAVLEEQMIEYYQVEKPKPEVVVLDEDDGDHD